MSYKQVLIVNKEFTTNKGTIIKDGALVSLKAAEKTKKQRPSIFRNWIKYGQKKVIVKLEKKLSSKQIINYCKKNRITCISKSIVKKGKSQSSSQYYLFALGPDRVSKLNSLTGQMKLL